MAWSAHAHSTSCDSGKQSLLVVFQSGIFAKYSKADFLNWGYFQGQNARLSAYSGK